MSFLRGKSSSYTRADVDYLVKEMVRLSKQKLIRDFPNAKATPRDAHAKCIGLLRGTFAIDATVPSDLQHGLFAQTNASFPCYVRFSNALGSVNGSDTDKDFRGIAIKLLGPEEEQTLQDFLLINKEDFPLGTPWMFLSVLYWGEISFLLVLLVFLFKCQLGALMRARGAVTASLADQSFFSTTPFALARAAPISVEEEETVFAVKYALRPLASNGRGSVLARVQGKNYLRDELRAHLNTNHQLIWEFCVQRRSITTVADRARMPLNDVSIVWSSEWVRVATLTIEDQEFNTEARFELAEALSFNLKHYQPMHQPIGIMNRVRMELYEQMSEFRHNRAGRRDPEASKPSAVAAAAAAKET